MHGTPMQIGQPNGVRSSDWLDITFLVHMVAALYKY